MIQRARTMATIPNPQFPTDKPTPNDKPGSNNTLLILLGGTAVAIGGWYYTQGGAEIHPHDQRKADEARAKQKAGELKDAGIATAHDAVKEGEKAYDDTKATAQGKLDQARADAQSTAASAQSKLDSYKQSAQQSIDHAKASATATYNDGVHKAQDTYNQAAHKVQEEKQSWGSWFGSWLGYGQAKKDEAKSEAAFQIAKGADKVESGAQKVEKEAQKRV
ncbi:hypothetical protein BC835DRAFT_1276707 [Cytidiella melzeri]|nr:hypothetical protein BC835DRAFT_1276707 [Cytidiella melzeri]